MKRILKLEANSKISLHTLVDLVKDSPRRAAVIAEEIKTGATAKQLNSNRVDSLERLSNHFDYQSPTMQRILQLESKERLKINELADYIGDNRNRAAIVAGELARQTSAKELTINRLEGLDQLAKYVPYDSEAMSIILEREKNNGLSLTKLAEFTAKFPKAATILEEKILAGHTDQIKDYQYWYSTTLEANMNGDQHLTEKLNMSGLTTLDRAYLAEFVNDNPNGGDILRRELQNGATNDQLDHLRLEALLDLESRFAHNENVIKQLRILEPHTTLSLYELNQLIKSNPRIADIVENEINSGKPWASGSNFLNRDRLLGLATLEGYYQRNSDIMRSIYKLEEEHGLDVGDLARHLDIIPKRSITDRDAVIDLLIKHQVSSEQLIAVVREMAYPTFRTIDLGNLELNDSVANFSLFARYPYIRNAGIPTEDLRASRQNSGAMPECTRKAAAIVLETATAIMDDIPKGEPIVILGRDAWPLVPVLRAWGRPTQYFLWSRLQLGDKSTQERWEFEVPRNAWVIDTGYAGSILQDIYKIDPSIKGMLICSESDYWPQLRPGVDHKNVVENLEYFPKITGRCSGYTPRGIAICRTLNKGGDCDSYTMTNPDVILGTTGLLRTMYLPESYVQQYARFTGLTPKERLGIKSTDKVDAHLNAVAIQRRPSAKSSNNRGLIENAGISFHAHGLFGTPVLKDGQIGLKPNHQRIAALLDIDPAMIGRQLNPGTRPIPGGTTAKPNAAPEPSFTVSLQRPFSHVNLPQTITESVQNTPSALPTNNSNKPASKPDETIPPSDLRQRYNKALESARSYADKTTPVRTNVSHFQSTANMDYAVYGANGKEIYRPQATNPISDRLKRSATNPLVLLKVAQSLAHAARGDMDKAKFHLKEAASIGGSNLVVSTATDATRNIALAKLTKELAKEAAPTVGQKIAVTAVRNLGTLVGEGFVVYSAANKETWGGTAAELSTGTMEVVATTALSTLLLQQGASKVSGPIAGIMATGDLIRFSGNLLATMGGGERPNPSVVQQAAAAVWDFTASQYIDRAQALKVDTLVHNLQQGPPLTPKAAEMYRSDYPERLVTGTDLEAAYRAFGNAKADSAAFLRSIFSSYDNEHSNLKQYFEQLARYEDAAELHIAGAKKYRSTVSALRIPGNIANPPVIDEKKYPRLAALAQQWKQVAPGMTFRERYDHIRESTLSTNNPVHMIDLPKDRKALFEEFAAFTMEKYIPYQVALIANHHTFIQNEKILQAFQQQSRKELQQKSWQLIQQACNELGMANNPDYKAIEAAYKKNPTEQNLQQGIDLLIPAAKVKQVDLGIF